VESRALFRPHAVSVAHPLVKLASKSLLGGVRCEFALPLSLVADKLANVDVFISINFIAEAVPQIFFPFALEHANNQLSSHWLVFSGKRLFEIDTNSETILDSILELAYVEACVEVVRKFALLLLEVHHSEDRVLINVLLTLP